MALKFKLATLDGLDDAIKALYAQKDGGFVLQVDGAESSEDVAGLKTALLKERENNAAYSKFGKPDELAAKIKALEEKKPGKGDDDHEKVIAQLKAAHEADLKAASEKFNGLVRRNATAELRAEMGKTGFIPESIDALALVGANRLRYNEDGSVTVLSPDGSQPMIGSGKDGGATLGDLAKELAKSNPYAVVAGGTGGGGKPPGSGGKPAAKTMPREQFDALPQAERMAFVKDGGAPA